MLSVVSMGVNISASQQVGSPTLSSTPAIPAQRTDVSAIVTNISPHIQGAEHIAGPSNATSLQRMSTEIAPPTRPVAVQPTVRELEAMGIKVCDFAYVSRLPPVPVVKRKARNSLPAPRPFKRTRPAETIQDERRWQRLLDIRCLSNQPESKKPEYRLSAELLKERLLIQEMTDQDAMEEALEAGLLKHHVAMLTKVNTTENRFKDAVSINGTPSTSQQPTYVFPGLIYYHSGSQSRSQIVDGNKLNKSDVDVLSQESRARFDRTDEYQASQPSQLTPNPSQPPLISASQSDSECDQQDASSLLTPPSSFGWNTVDSSDLPESQVARMLSPSRPVKDTTSAFPSSPFGFVSSQAQSESQSQSQPQGQSQSMPLSKPTQPTNVYTSNVLPSPSPTMSSSYTDISSQSGRSPEASTSLVRALARELSRSSSMSAHSPRRSPRRHEASTSPHKPRSAGSRGSPRSTIINPRPRGVSLTQAKKAVNGRESPSSKARKARARKMNVDIRV